MTKNPFLNALCASLYIVSISFVMYFGSQLAPKDDSILAPIAVISLFTLSAAVMGYIFCFQPAQIYLGGKKSQGIKLFLQTVVIFGLLTMLALAFLFTGLFH